MKIIELLNLISKGEEVPKKIKYRKCIFEYEEKYKDYFTKDGIIPTTFDTNGIFRNIFLDYNNFLNDEVEIIEPQEHKIPGKIEYHQVRRNEVEVDYIEDGIVKHFCLNKKQRYFADKINEILDYLEVNNE